MAKQPSKGPLGQLIWTEETLQIFARFTSFVKIATFLRGSLLQKHGNICQTLVNSRQICYLRQVLYFWTYLVLTKNPATDSPTVPENFSECLRTVVHSLTEAKLKQKKLASSTEMRKWIYYRFILLPCLRQETRVTDSFPFTQRIIAVELSSSSYLLLVASTLY